MAHVACEVPNTAICARPQHIRSVLEAAEGVKQQNDKQEAFDVLQPLVWQQLTAQGTHFNDMIVDAHDMNLVSMKNVRQDEQLGGWLNVRTADVGDSPTADWARRFCGLVGTTLLWYEDDQSPLPEGVVCLQFATLGAQSQHRFAFTLSTPLREMELQAVDQRDMDRWADAILAVQATESFAKLVPQGMRKQHFSRWFKNKLFSKRSDRYATVSADLPTEMGGVLVESRSEPDMSLATIMGDPELREIFHSFASEQGASKDSELLQRLSDADVVDEDALIEERVDQLPDNVKREIVRVSLLHNAEHASDDQSLGIPTENTAVQQALAAASEKLFTELLPRFCETDQFQSWLREHNAAEQAELCMLAIVQSAAGIDAFHSWLTEQASSEGIVALDLFGDNAFSATRRNSANSMSVLTRLYRAFARTEAFQVTMDALKAQQEANTGLLHWLHTTDGFSSLTDFLRERCASENIDFFRDVLKFKRLDDVGATKDHANRIHAKYLADGSLAQVGLPMELLKQVRTGLEPKFPSLQLFDEAAEHVTLLMQQELWSEFLDSPAYSSVACTVHSELSNATEPPLIAITTPDDRRYVTRIFKKIVTIGSSVGCDVVLKTRASSAAARSTVVLRVDPAAAGDSCAVTLLWGGNQGSLTAANGRAPQHSGEINVAYGAQFCVGDLEIAVFRGTD